MLPLAKLAPLMYLAGYRLEDLQMSDFRKIAEVLNIKVDITDELKEAGLAMLRGENIHTVADMIKSPQSLQQLVLFIQGRTQREVYAEAEVIALMSGDIGIDQDPAYVSQNPVSFQQHQASPIISNPLVGWRLPG